ncbi:elongation factor P maturation arginine rhamnosyltransferase EarP [Piscinibacter sp. HJYY11]|uniref:elongation factor P maturation arginine rhamnosyltransferase EarP n=1 Tax=Piscinibacter sp. HJYY11 TaxID=2801333 RepID=UPI00191F810C|nr:elongation factor P maturation arginine rhamnosyltransferase EarP [Piscinibacter sp. HJYY11]MBL0731077.1 elongation factor P maturation arginine rhamnosyltransferase EarP [Piscinibacter sp. HJYY11]
MQWDVFCQVIDNYGDIGVCWRLSADLASRGHAVRLWIDDPAAFAWMAPEGATGVTVLPWQASLEEAQPGDVVIEAFGCTVPDAFVARMAAATRPPRWINLEYLSAESYVERSHRLPSPQWQGPGKGLTKWFFYPGFTPATGGLLREPDLIAAHAHFNREAWLAAHGITPHEGERLVSLFSYENPAFESLLASLGKAPTLLLLAAGRTAPSRLPAQVRCQTLPYLRQPDYDRLLWSCDLNFVRGEDSFVRAQWAGKPFVWHIYPQADGAHAAKLDAFLDRFPHVPGLRALWHAWNGLGPWPLQTPEPSSADWTTPCRYWREQLLAQPDLTTQLVGFATEAG